jgi:hypothetical protein
VKWVIFFGCLGSGVSGFLGGYAFRDLRELWRNRSGRL